MISKVLEVTNLYRAERQVMRNKGACSINRIPVQNSQNILGKTEKNYYYP